MATALKPDRKVLEQYTRRLQEVLEEAEEVGKHFDLAAMKAHFQVCSSDEDLRARIAPWVNEIRVPGFCAYALAEEGLTLLNLIAVRVCQARENPPTFL